MAAMRYLVHDVPACIGFYTEHLGFSLVQQFGPAMAILSRGDLTLWLAGPAFSAAKPMPDGAQPAPGGWNRIVLEIDGLDTAVARLQAAGARLRNDILAGRVGPQILVEDPSGNPVELFEAR